MRRLLILAVLLSLHAVGSAVAQTASTGTKTIADRVAGLRKLDGYVPLYWDEASGRLLLEISRFDQEFLYQVSLAAGVGSNPVGLDRGQVGPSAAVRFERVGPKVLLVQTNYGFRALGAPAAEQRAVADSFATSVLWGFTVDAAEGERVLVDATSFFVRDAHGVADRLRATKQGSYRLDETRSAVHLPRTKVFPKNTEVEVTLTFVTTDTPGPLVREVTPSPQAMTVREHHSLVELPGDGYAPRRFDPRVGFIPLTVYDYASPITSPLETRWIQRHRLQKINPSAQRSDAVQPIVYYVDNGAPPLIRQALIDGASWWSRAFAAAGFPNGFQVKVLPADADSMDIRYNVINWVHRSTRGWSYGASVVDPRTGEIIKGNVTLGSLRVRQNIMIASGLTSPFDGRNGSCGFADAPEAAALVPDASDEVVTGLALARLRQLAAHEVGHTLGLEHNFAASTYQRGSVMDYPAPLVTVKNGELDLSEAYATGVGAYDIWAIQFGYGQWPAADETAALARGVDDGLRRGLLFVSDEDARGLGTAHALGALWDNGPDPIDALKQQIQVRRLALARFGLGSLPDGLPLSLLESRLLPIYLLHRYQVNAAAKSVGGAMFTYSVKTATGPSPTPVLTIVSPERQRAALATLLETIAPPFLALPSKLLELIPPTAYGYGTGTAEPFARRTSAVFDSIGAATIAADFAVSALLQPERAARLIEFHGRSDLNPDFDEVVAAIVTKAFGASAPAATPGAIARAVQELVATRLTELASNDAAAFEVRAGARQALRLARGRLSARTDAAGVVLRQTIDQFLSQPTPPAQTAPLPTPQGEPIG